MKKLMQKKRMYPVWFLLASAAYFGGAAAFFRTFVDWKHIPLVIISSILMLAGFSFGLLLAATAGEKAYSDKTNLLIFIVANLLSHALLWTVLTLVNVEGMYNRRAIYTALFIFMPLFLLFALIILHRIPDLGIRLVNKLLAFACTVGMLAGAMFPVVGDPKAFLIKCLSPIRPQFDSISSESLTVTEDEKEKCRQWYDEHILLNAEKPEPAFSFKADGIDLKDTVSFYELTRTEPQLNEAGGETTVVTMTRSGLQVRVVGTVYKERATCEWTVYIKNTGDKNTDVLSNVSALEKAFSVRSPALYYSTGSQSGADDFTLKKAYLPPTVQLNFYPVGGRSSDGYLPYFNISGRDGGIVAAIGWTGEWKNDVEKTDDGVRLSIGQKDFSAYLLPGEEIRTPRVSLTFYSSKNPMKGFNLFRSYIARCVTPANIPRITSFVLADEFSTLTATELIEKANTIPAEKQAFFNTFWMDAGWYDYTENWADGVGTWSANRLKFPNTLIEVGNTAAQMDKKYLLWFEPERVRKDTYLYVEGMKYPEWLVEPENGDNYLWNLANNDAADFLLAYITAAIKENGVTVYRQDFNFEPLAYWQKADAAFYGGRTGIAENRYVTNYYRYLDGLFENNPGLIMDNCASGGRRLDLEMAARSVPLWRSDYNCNSTRADILEATQAMTYGLSFWLPSYGTSYYTQDVYAARSSIMPCCSTGDGSSEFIGAYESQRDNMLKNYFPLTKGGSDDTKTLAMQYGNQTEGHAVVYLRKRVKDESVKICFSGLASDRLYVVSDRDDPENTVEMSGSQLMKTGITVPVQSTRTALIYEYRQK